MFQWRESMNTHVCAVFFFCHAETLSFSQASPNHYPYFLSRLSRTLLRLYRTTILDNRDVDLENFYRIWAYGRSTTVYSFIDQNNCTFFGSCCRCKKFPYFVVTSNSPQHEIKLIFFFVFYLFLLFQYTVDN